ncbi:SURF1 family protein [Sphingomonas sp. NIBR02145]|uniref:SURF1 family protein n=1 Tax=Sphingomonas sp. NIBR02145 TaxID=3014784 RepID=UPI0022B42AA5|nr:SURF1 family protein [Sphingomonas sp. NIBR02145]WHU01319.1 SURF1 family protein [Sphingomonas sp. NIBR02145]
MPRFPLIPTIIVALAVAAMIGLGIWQLERRSAKLAALQLYAQNLGKPKMAFPRLPVGDENLFRRADAFCLEVIDWQPQGGRSIKGTNGYRHIARCRTGAEGPLLLVDMGVAANPTFFPTWSGGKVTGTITHAPDHRPLLAGLFDSEPKHLMLISESAAPGLEPTAKPDLSSVPNNHLSYAVQWFLFALIASVIYVLALRWRQKPKA